MLERQAMIHHRHLHEPSYTYGNHFDAFALDPLVYMHILRSFHIHYQTEPLPTISMPNCTSYLECTDTTFAFTNYIKTYPLVLDTGASISITPVLSDFIDDLQPSLVTTVHGINSKTNVVGSGTVEWKVNDVHGNLKTIRTFALYIPSAQVRLFSPQDFFRIQQTGTVHITKHDTRLFLQTDSSSESPILFPYHGTNGLPMIINDMVQFQHSAYHNIHVPFPQYFAYNSHLTLHPDNHTLSSAQKELLL